MRIIIQIDDGEVTATTVYPRSASPTFPDAAPQATAALMAGVSFGAVDAGQAPSEGGASGEALFSIPQGMLGAREGVTGGRGTVTVSDTPAGAASLKVP